jgi:hypothetical protein
MKQVWWMKQVGICLVALTMLTGVAWADPIGTASVFQFVSFFAFNDVEVPQQVFRSTDNIGFRAVYFDPNADCAGVAPVLARLIILTAEGRVITQISAFHDELVGGQKTHGVFVNVTPASSLLVPGSYYATYVVRECSNTFSTVLTPFLPFRVVAP